MPAAAAAAAAWYWCCWFRSCCLSAAVLLPLEAAEAERCSLVLPQQGLLLLLLATALGLLKADGTGLELCRVCSAAAAPPPPLSGATGTNVFCSSPGDGGTGGGDSAADGGRAG